MSNSYAIVIHGGAENNHGQLDEERSMAYRLALQAIIEQGDAWLASGLSALDCVTQVAVLLEDNPLFNAGKGSVLNEKGQAELDAALMSGNTLQAGAVVAVRSIKNPILAARAILDNGRHVCLAADGAELFAREAGLAFVAPSYFLTETSLSDYHRSIDVHQHTGTIGVVAFDRNGQLAAATSTGGVNRQHPGRIGDTGVIGAGVYANQTAAVSCTGQGEAFIRQSVAHKVTALIEYAGMDLAAACDRAIADLDSLKAAGGLIAVDAYGNIATPRNTDWMFCASSQAGKIHVAI